MARIGRGYPVRPKVVRPPSAPAGPTPHWRVASMSLIATGNAVMRVWLLQLDSPQQTLVWDADSGTWIPGTPPYTQTVDAYTTVTLPAGTWTQTGGPPVVLDGNTFTAPAVKGGTTLTFTSGANTATVSVNGWRVFIHTATGLQGVKVVQA
jgi:hypothetical protein